MAASWVVRRLCSTAAEKAAPVVKGTRWERLKNSKAAGWCRGLLTDYKEACREVVVGAWERPIKASVYLGMLGGTWACFYTNPDDTSFETSLLETSNKLGLLSPWIRNGTSDGHLQNLIKLQNQGRLRYASLGVASLTYCANYDPESRLYEAVCSNLSVPWRELPSRVLDVGFAGRWWILDTKMKDYDVNMDEFKNLPPAMVATVPPGVQEVERNERLHKESWLPLKMEEDDDDKKKTAEGKEEGKERDIVEQLQEQTQTLEQTESETQEQAQAQA